MAKRKHQGPPYIIGRTELGGKRAFSVGRLRQLGLMCLQSVDEQPPKAVNPLSYLEIHNLRATEKWLLVHLPCVDPRSVELPAEFVELEMEGQHTDRYDWSIVSELGRVSGDKHSSPADVLTNGEFKCTLDSLCSERDVLARNKYPTEGLKLDRIAGTNEGYAVDCEMCLSGTTQVLTWIAVVRFSDGECVLNQLVKPREEITDYVTQYSGITAEMLQDVQFDLADVQAWLQSHIGRTDILIGHSLNNDLNVLGITHDKIVDTALVFPHYLGPAYQSSLRYLSRKFLNKEIQSPDTQGHDPVEDAKTCDQLVRWVMVHGSGYRYIDPHATKSFTTFLAQSGIKSTVVGARAPVWDADGVASHIVVSDPVEPTVNALQSGSEFVVSTMDSSQLAQLLSHKLPPRTLVTLCFGPNYGLRGEIQDLRARKKRYARDFKTMKWDEIEDPWTAEDDTILKTTVNKFGTGYVYLAITLDPAEKAEWPTSVRQRVCGDN